MSPLARARAWTRGTLAIASRELLSLFVTPLGYVVATLFLLQQGYDFALLLRVLNDPLAAPGPVMQFYFGGSFFIFWLPVVAICSAVAMRLVAEERRQGTLEAVLTAPVQPSQFALGKFIAAFAFYAALWLPTAVFYLLLRGAAVEVDVGPIAAGYLGTALVGASFLAIGLVASAAARSQLSAAIATFVVCSLVLMLGLLAPEVESPTLAAWLEQTSLLAMMQDLAQGIVDGRWLWLHGAIVVLGVWAAALLVDPRRDLERVLQWGLGAIVVVHVAWWGARHATRDDWTGGQVYALSERAREQLEGIAQPVEVRTMIPPLGGGGRPNPLAGELREVLRRMAEVSPQLRVTEIDPDRDRQEAEQLVAQYGLSGRDLADGVVLVQSGVGTALRRTQIMPDELVVWATGADVQQTGPRVEEFRGEEALLGAFAQVQDARETHACVTQGHGEPAIDGLEPYGGIAHFADLLRARDIEVQIADLDGHDGLASCDLVIVAGPSGQLPVAHVDAITRYADGGGDLLVLAGAVMLPGQDRLARHGLEPLLARWGLALGERVVVDPHAMPGGTPLLAFTLVEGWGDHPIVRALVGRAASLMLVRELELGASEGEPPVALLSVGEDGWAESDLAGLARGVVPERGPGDREGPVVVAAAGVRGGSKLVLVASDQFVLNAFLRDDVVYDHGRDLVRNAIGWLTDRARLLGIEARPREHVKLVLLPAQLERMTWVCLLGLPGFAVAMGLWMLWRRRR
ncbi:MAG: Gldg family protein [Deltaproteobacteria bacterium]|nr:Gldg family protein [Deltaproteobacteria bacterium]MBK8719890.1 Gldg family protein [Deltaproteobacteria bacterium]MBP7290713.1 Gldg family protein [Nannocystaceae bacterium]